jgi:ParB family transcriptional regulator, chromosome partitioning protein
MSNDHDRNQRKALGKGLSALLPSKPIVVQPPTSAPAAKSEAVPYFVLPESFEDFQSIPLDQIKPGSDQPRNVFDAEPLQELAQSIRANGLLQPITVQRDPDGIYRIIAGERRWRACQLAGLKEIPALVRKVEKRQGLELALIENIQREDLNPMDIATAFEKLSSEHGLSHEQIAERTGKDRSTVTNFLRLLKLGDAAKNELRGGSISVGHARALLNVPDEREQLSVCYQIVTKKLSVRETEALIKRMNAEQRQLSNPELKEEPKIDPNIRAALDDMAMALGTKVNLTPRKLEIEYYSQEDLDRIYSVIVRQ